jgi:hypothetical protein
MFTKRDGQICPPIILMIDKPQMWWTIIVLLWIPSAHAQAFCALSDKTFCLYSEERGSQIALRLHAYKSVGWISVGFGTSMANADVYVRLHVGIYSVRWHGKEQMGKSLSLEGKAKVL